jgi:hypothetical protein
MEEDIKYLLVELIQFMDGESFDLPDRVVELAKKYGVEV